MEWTSLGCTERMQEKIILTFGCELTSKQQTTLVTIDKVVEQQ